MALDAGVERAQPPVAGHHEWHELIARFGHHLALTWNLGEENTNTDQQRKDFAAFIRGLDPYDHPIVVHTYPGQDEAVYRPLLGDVNLDGPSLQIGSTGPIHADTIQWLDESEASGRPWVVNLDEIGPAGSGVLPDASDPTHDTVRKQALWGNLMAGGGGVEWYFGYNYAHDDLDCEDWRSRDAMWDQTRYALELFRQHLPFGDVAHSDALTSSTSDYCLANPGEVYVAPYALAGDTNGNYNSWTPSVGSHTVTATPYTAASAGGTAGTPLTLSFQVTN